jgi:hypothetical protein
MVTNSIISALRYNTFARTFCSLPVTTLTASNYAHCVPVTSADCVYVGVLEWMYVGVNGCLPDATWLSLLFHSKIFFFARNVLVGE